MNTNGTVRRRTGLWHNEDARRFVSLVATGVLLALLTGADGSEDDYLLSFRESLLSIRLPICIGLMVLVWAVLYLGQRRKISLSPAATGAAFRQRRLEREPAEQESEEGVRQGPEEPEPLGGAHARTVPQGAQDPGVS